MRAESGTASVYDYSQTVACGGRYDRNALTAAHRTLPCGSKVRVTSKRNGKSVVVTINDRGPFARGRIIDLSLAAAGAISMPWGLMPVTIEVMQ
jgi:rare lipoprotein A